MHCKRPQFKATVTTSNDTDQTLSRKICLGHMHECGSLELHEETTQRCNSTVSVESRDRNKAEIWTNFTVTKKQ